MNSGKGLLKKGAQKQDNTVRWKKGEKEFKSPREYIRQRSKIQAKIKFRTKDFTLAWRCSGVAAMRQIMVEQLGLAMSAPFPDLPLIFI